jgi:MraZ protein
MLLGQFPHTIDSKGRVSVPAAFRDALLDDPTLVLVPIAALRQHFIDAYPMAVFADKMKEFQTRDQYSEDAVTFGFGVIGRAHACEIDGAGRILIPPPLRAFAGLKKDVVFSGLWNYFRLVDAEVWGAIEGGIDAKGANDPAPFKGNF